MTANHHIVVIDDSPLAVVDVSKPLASDEVEVEVEVENGSDLAKVMRRAPDLDTYISQQRSIDGIVGEGRVWLADPPCRYQERA